MITKGERELTNPNCITDNVIRIVIEQTIIDPIVEFFQKASSIALPVLPAQIKLYWGGGHGSPKHFSYLLSARRKYLALELLGGLGKNSRIELLPPQKSSTS